MPLKSRASLQKNVELDVSIFCNGLYVDRGEWFADGNLGSPINRLRA